MEENKNLTETVDEQEQEEKTYTEAEVLKLIQREADKRVSQALKTQREKFERKQSEAEKLSRMNDEQRKEYEFEQKLQEFEQQKKEFALMQNKIEASKVMAERGLPIQFVDYIVTDEADTMLENINTFEMAFKAAVADAVTAKIGTGSPKGGTGSQSSITKEQFKKMTLAQQTELYASNPTLYKALAN